MQDILIEADSLQMAEIFNNVLNNACDAIPPSTGKIEITGTLEEGAIKIVIKDNGAGIKPDDMDKVFDPFFTTKSKGTGLGLSVCLQIINLHEGKIELQSKEGEGTTVTITLPRHKRS